MVVPLIAGGTAEYTTSHPIVPSKEPVKHADTSRISTQLNCKLVLSFTKGS